MGPPRWAGALTIGTSVCNCPGGQVASVRVDGVFRGFVERRHFRLGWLVHLLDGEMEKWDRILGEVDDWQMHVFLLDTQDNPVAVLVCRTFSAPANKTARNRLITIMFFQSLEPVCRFFSSFWFRSAGESTALLHVFRRSSQMSL